MSSNDARTRGQPSKQDRELFAQRVNTLVSIGRYRYFAEFDDEILVSTVDEVANHLGRGSETIRDKYREAGMVPIPDAKDYSKQYIALVPFAKFLGADVPNGRLLIDPSELNAAIDKANSAPAEFRSRLYRLYLDSFEQRSNRSIPRVGDHEAE